MELHYRPTSRPYVVVPSFPPDTPDAVILETLRKNAEGLHAKGAEITINYEKCSCQVSQGVYCNSIYDNEITEYHNHNFYEINYVFSGKLYQYIDGTVFVMHPGDILLMHPSVRHSPYADSGGGRQSINLLITKPFLETFVAKYDEENFLTRLVSKRGYVVFGTRDNEAVTQLFTAIEQYRVRYFKKGSPMKLYYETLIELMLSQLVVSEFNAVIINIWNRSTTSEDRPNQLISYVNTNFATVSMDDLCRRFSYSRMQIYRIFKKHTGLNFSDYIGDLRFDRIRYLLTRTNLSIEDIGRIVGLNRSYIYDFFKQRTGVSPLQFRKHLNGEMSPLY